MKVGFVPKQYEEILMRITIILSINEFPKVLDSNATVFKT
jgi:hypothetical protein